MIQRIVSPLGIEAWLVEDYAVPVIGMQIAFRGGGAQDPAGKAGATNIMASLLNEGAGSLNDEAFQRRLEETAVELHFQIDHDALHGSLRTLADKCKDAFALLKLSLNEPRFDPEPFERIRQELLAMLRHRASDPGTVAGEALSAALFPGHPYGLSDDGTVETVEKLTREDVVTQHRHLIARDNVVISIVGAINANAVSAMLDDVFGGLAATAHLTAVPDVAPAAFGTKKIIDFDVPQTDIQFALPGVRRSDPDYMAAVVANHILGGGAFSSWLYQTVREERGLAYSVYTHLNPRAKAGTVEGAVATRNDKAAESLSLIEAEIGRLVADGPTDAELKSAKSYITGSFALGFDSSTKIASRLTQMQLDNLGIDYIDRRNSLVDAVTLEDVNRISRRLFAGKKPCVVAVGRPVGL